jgi:S-(hydroxymethyl)glutathione dehydrogenase/alcohol dehydrogenase
LRRRRAVDHPGGADRRRPPDHRNRHVRGEGGDRPPHLRGLTGGLGVDHAFEAVGNAKLCRQAIESLAIRGTATIVGVLPPDAMIEFPWMAIRPECKVQTSRMGSNRFRTDIPLYLDFYRQGRLNLDAMVTKRGKLGDINEAFRAMKAGEVARTVLTFD